MRADGGAGDSLSYSNDVGGGAVSSGGGGGASYGGDSPSSGGSESASSLGPGGGDAGAVAGGLNPKDDPRIYGYSNTLDPVSSAQLYNQLFGAAGGKQSPVVVQTSQPESAASRIGVGVAIALGSALVYFLFKKKGGAHASAVD